MNEIASQLAGLYERIPRRHNPDNVKEINAILDEYEDLLQELEAKPEFETVVAPFFDAPESIRALVKKSSENKNSKKQKDEFFDDASGQLKDAIDEAKERFGK